MLPERTAGPLHLEVAGQAHDRGYMWFNRWRDVLRYIDAQLMLP